ncbi:MAG: hypothetical protein V4529_13750 [Gemmatimonadota bacterium]
MDPDAITFAFVMVVCVLSLGCLAVIGTWTFRAFRGHKDPERLPQQNYDERFAQLQQSVDAIAVEVERIAEGQRFSTRLLSEGARVPVDMEDR